MTRLGTLNGDSHLELPDGMSVFIEHYRESSFGRSPAVTVAARRGGSVLWRACLEDMAGDPTLKHSDSVHEDFCGVVWRRTGVVGIAGDPRAVLLRINDGSEVARFDLGFVEKASLDLLSFVLDRDEHFLAIVSTRRALLVDDQFRVRMTYEPDGILERVVSLSSGNLKVAEYDVNQPETPVIERSLAVGPY